MSRPALPGSDDAETRRKGSGKDRVGGDVPPGWPSRVLGDRVVAERSGSVSGVAPSEPASAPVGRARELTAIATAMATAGRGRARVVHLVGEPGIGKTALAEHAAALASEQGWMVAWGRAWAADAAPPYWLWQQVLGSLVRTTNVSTRVHPATAAWLVDLVPELAGPVRCRRPPPWTRTAPVWRCNARSSTSWARPPPTGRCWSSWTTSTTPMGRRWRWPTWCAAACPTVRCWC